MSIDSDRSEHARELLVTVHNEDNGLPVEIHAEPESLVSTVIAKMYEKFNLTRKPNDRLRCESTGADVFAYANDRLSAYEHTRCRDLVWLFAGDQGGA